MLLIDEIDKTDQEFEAMLLELLSDFQISIPELGRIEARTHPVVLLTSNNSRELTEALKRRCLYLWLDYPTAERELEIVRLHAPELPETVARRLVEVIAMVRELDLKKPPSIAESIDWARALLLLGAEDIDQQTFRDTMSIIVKHRTDLDTVAERVGVRLAALSESAAAPDRLRRRAARRGRGARHVRAQRRVRRARRGRVDAARAVPRGAGGDAGEVARGPARLRPRVRALLLPRRRGRRARGGRARGRRAEGGGITGGERIDYEALREQILEAIRNGDEAALRDLARLAIAAFGRRGEGSGVLGVDVQRIRRALGLKSETGRAGQGRGRAVRVRRSRASRSGASRRTCGASSSARRSNARRRCRRRGR